MKRIKDLTATATTPSSDDYLLLDGNTNGTRKILADLPVSTATQSALNNKANLSGATFTGRITATNLSGTNTGDQNLSGLVLKTTTVNGHALSSNVTVTATDTGAPTISSGTTAPTSTPAKVGDMYVDTVLKRTYVANGTSSSADWIKQNGSYTLDGGILYAMLSPAGATTYYFGQPMGYGYGAANQHRVHIPRSGTITKAYINVFNNTGGSGETSSLYIRVNNTTDYLASSSIVNGGIDYFSNTGLSIPVVAGDYIEFKWITPTWATNPQNILMYVRILVDL